MKFFPTLIKYKVFHFVFWLLIILRQFHLSSIINNDNISSFINFSLIAMAFLSIYFIQFVGINYLLNKKKIFFFIILCIITIFCASLLHCAILNLICYKKIASTFHNYILFVSTIVDIFIPNLLYLAVVLVYKSIIDLKDNYEQKEKLMHYEIDLLRQQMNPHFLFNALNSIYIMIDNNTEDAKNYLHKFSQLLGHQIYESQHAFVPLSREINFIKDYSSIEKIRKEKDLDFMEIYDIANPDFLIPPMLLQPLVENSFKYVSNQLDRNYIELTCKCSDQFFTFFLSNSIDTIPIQYGKGFGLQAIKKHLELHYANKYTFETSRTNNTYTVTLTIQILKP